MDGTGLPLLLMLGGIAATPLLAGVYGRRYALRRPPLGVINGWDVAALMVAIVAAPVLYLGLTRPLAAALLGAAILGVLYTLAEPVLRARWAVWLAALALTGADVAAARGGPGITQQAVNDLVVLLTVAGMANLWAQGGMSPQALAALAAFLAVYDPVATTWLPVTEALMAHLGDGPFAPLLSWGDGAHQISIGLGDLLVAATYPLVMRRAFGVAAGRVAFALAVGALAVVLLVVALGARGTVLPAMAALGPIIVLHYLGRV